MIGHLRPIGIFFVDSLSSLTKGFFALFNLELRFKTKDFLQTLLSGDAVLEVYDVGANRGQYALRCRAAGYRGRIYSFEPLVEENLRLQALAQKDDEWIAIAPVALGSQRGTSVINKSENSVSSSLLNINKAHTDLHPQSVYSGVQETPIETLDFYFQMHHQEGNTCLLKLDVQGYENQVLEGSSKTLGKVDYIQIEMSLINLYDQSVLLHEMNSLLLQKGFELVDIILGIRNTADNSLAQIDGIYRRIDHAQ